MAKIARTLVFLAAATLPACMGGIDESPARSRTDPRFLPFVPAETGMRRLTVTQYDRTLRDLLDDDVRVSGEISADLSAEEGFELSDVLATQVTSSDLDVGRYDTAARHAVELVFADAARREALVGCAPVDADDPCIDAFLERFLRRAFRRPAAMEELVRYRTLARNAAAELEGVWLGLRYAVATILQSPYFLYRIEIGSEGRFDDYELASRLSYFLWDTTPDEALLDAAARGELSTDEGLRRETERLLNSPRARAPITRFFTEWLSLDALDRISKNTDVFPIYRDTFGPSMRRELELLIEEVVFTDDASVLSLLDIDHTYVNADLAEIYGIEGLGGAATLVETWQAEEASPAGCAVVEGFANVCAESELAHEVTTTASGLHRFSAQVYGAQAGPDLVRMSVSIDGVDVGTYDIDATEAAPQLIRVERELAPGVHRFAVRFLNDYYMPPDNRDLRVDFFRLESLAGPGSDFVAVPLPPERRGLMTLAGPLSLLARPIDTSPTQRGLFIRERMLCEHIDPPPPGVSTMLPAPTSGHITNRERVSLHQTSPTCRTCHVRMDPLGLPLEGFDGLGVYRETDRGLTLDLSGDLDGETFDGPIELAETLASDTRVRDCIARLMFRRGAGMREEMRQLGSLHRTAEAFDRDTMSLRSLIEAFVLSESFRTAGVAQ